jgi:hypothetical protein
VVRIIITRIYLIICQNNVIRFSPFHEKIGR